MGGHRAGPPQAPLRSPTKGFRSPQDREQEKQAARLRFFAGEDLVMPAAPATTPAGREHNPSAQLCAGGLEDAAAGVRAVDAAPGVPARGSAVEGENATAGTPEQETDEDDDSDAESTGTLILDASADDEDEDESEDEDEADENEEEEEGLDALRALRDQGLQPVWRKKAPLFVSGDWVAVKAAAVDGEKEAGLLIGELLADGLDAQWRHSKMWRVRIRTGGVSSSWRKTSISSL